MIYQYGQWLLISKKNDVSGGPKCEPIKMCISIVCKNVIDEFENCFAIKTKMLTILLVSIVSKLFRKKNILSLLDMISL